MRAARNSTEHWGKVGRVLCMYAVESDAGLSGRERQRSVAAVMPANGDSEVCGGSAGPSRAARSVYVAVGDSSQQKYPRRSEDVRCAGSYASAELCASVVCTVARGIVRK